MTARMRIDGVDISRHQGDTKIDWRALKAAGVKWMYHKATEGSTFKDEHYQPRRLEAMKNGMPFGAYHFARPSGGDAKDEAAFFIQVAKPQPGDLRPCLDLEVMDGLSMPQIVTWADVFCAEVVRLTGVMPVIYTPYKLSDALESKAIFWVPRYNNSNTPPTRGWDIWQFSNGQYGVPNRVPGLGHVDLNHSKIGVQELLIPVKGVPDPRTGGARVEHAISDLEKAEKKAPEGSRRDTILKRALRVLKRTRR